MEQEDGNKDGVLRLDSEALQIITELCGNIFSEGMDFGSFDTMEPDMARTGFLVSLIQYSSGWINKVNEESRGSGGMFNLLQMNPEKRFSVNIREFSSAGIHYLKTNISLDPCGKVLHVGRWWSQGPVPLRESDEQERSVYSNDSFAERIRRESPLNPSIRVNDVRAAREHVEDLAEKIKGRTLLRLPLEDPYRGYNPDGSERWGASFGYNGRK